MKSATSGYLSISLAVFLVPTGKSSLPLLPTPGHPPSAAFQPGAQPASELMAIMEQYAKCDTDVANKNAGAAIKSCKIGWDPLRKSRDLQQKMVEMSQADRILDRKVRSARELIVRARLDSARQRLDEVKDYAADSRYIDVDSGLKKLEAQYQSALKAAEGYEKDHDMKKAHSKYKQAQDINKDAPLGPRIKSTSQAAVFKRIIAASALGKENHA